MVASITFWEASMHAVLELSMASQMVSTVGAHTPKLDAVALHLGGMLVWHTSSHLSVPLQ